MWPDAEGKVVRPPLDAIGFLPQRPYLPPGTLRDLLLRTETGREVSEDRVRTVLRDVGLGAFPDRCGGLDVERDWPATLSLGEQQLLAIARLILAQPTFAMLDRVGASLSPDRLRDCLRLLHDNGITYITLAEVVEAVELHDAVLELNADGTWRWRRSDTHDFPKS